jgi:hypothetical protein
MAATNLFSALANRELLASSSEEVEPFSVNLENSIAIGDSVVVEVGLYVVVPVRTGAAVVSLTLDVGLGAEVDEAKGPVTVETAEVVAIRLVDKFSAGVLLKF